MSEIPAGAASTVSEITDTSASRAVPDSLSELLAKHGTNMEADSGQRIVRKRALVDGDSLGTLVHGLLGLGMAATVAVAAQATPLAWGVAVVGGLLAGSAILRLHQKHGGYSDTGFAYAMLGSALIAMLHAASPAATAVSYQATTVITGGIAITAVIVTAYALITGRLAVTAQAAAPVAAVAATLIVI